MQPRLIKTDNLAPVTITRAALHETAVKFAEEIFARKGAIASPIWIVAIDQRLAWFETPWESDREKDLSANVLRELMQLTGAHAYAFITEAWMAVDTKEKPLPENYTSIQGLPPDMRDDVLMITTFDKAGGLNATRYLVTIRHRGRGLNFLGPRDDHCFDEHDNMEGRFWNLLKK